MSEAKTTIAAVFGDDAERINRTIARFEEQGVAMTPTTQLDYETVHGLHRFTAQGVRVSIATYDDPKPVVKPEEPKAPEATTESPAPEAQPESKPE